MNCAWISREGLSLKIFVVLGKLLVWVPWVPVPPFGELPLGVVSYLRCVGGCRYSPQGTRLVPERLLACLLHLFL